MEQYYYLVSSLPSLRWGDTPAIDIAEFMKLCREHLNPKDFARLNALTLLPDSKISFPKKTTAALWREWDAELRHAMADRRHPRHAAANMPGSEARLNTNEIYHHKNPAVREHTLDGLRWKRLEALEFGHYFDINRLYIYKFKLLLHDKWRQRNVETGYRNFDRIIAAVTPAETAQTG
jgi:hypothetical protein